MHQELTNANPRLLPVSWIASGLRKTLERTIHERYVAFEADHLVIDSLIEALNDPEKIGILFPRRALFANVWKDLTVLYWSRSHKPNIFS